MSQGSLNPKIRFLGQKVCSVARVQTDTQTDTKVNTEDTLSVFHEVFLQPIIHKNRLQCVVVLKTFVSNFYKYRHHASIQGLLFV